MKYFLSLIFVVAAFNLTKAQNAWQLIETEDYSIEFPSQPIHESQLAPSEIGDLKLDIRLFEVVEIEQDDNYVYGIISTEYPAGTAHSDDKPAHASIFEHAVNGAVTNVDGKLLSNKEVEINGYPGRDFRIDFQNGLAVIRMKAYLVKNKLFILQTICDPKKEGNISAERFFSSFKLK
ncbi:MAG: hypothetical protein MUC59_15240 [Saprospiraceae bacterium]|jgi:hypothetical protein|nr:hypothetical protein [Saprospiraceae bacterium]